MASAPEDINNQMLSESDVKLLQDQELGRGAYGRVFRAEYRGSPCAAKEVHSILIEAERERLRENFIRECDHCSKLNHPNIVHFIGIFYPPQQLHVFPVMIMELMNESLTAYAKKSNISFTKRTAILRDVVEGLSYLHSRNPAPVIHRDLSPNNVLLKHMPGFSVAKIADLGVAKMINVDDKRSLTKVPGTVDFMPPEATQHRPKYDMSLDVFSYGGIILYTINGKWPTPTALTNFDPVTRQIRGFSEVERRQEHLDEMTGEAKALRPLVESCLDNDPLKRPPIFELSEKIKAIMNQKRHMFVAQKIRSMLHKSEDISKKSKKLTVSAVKTSSQDVTKGTYSQVYKVKCNESFCVAKEIDPGLIKTMKKEELRRFQYNFIRECCCCDERTHPNIVRFVGIYYPSRWQSLPVAAVMESMNEPLTSYLNEQTVTLKRKMLILYDVAEGLSYLHTSKPPVIHCNLSTDNVLLRHLPTFPIAKISNFSMLKVLLADVETRFAITPEAVAFMPPELFTSDDVCNTSLDVFSYGATMLHTICGERPMPTSLVEFNTSKYPTAGGFQEYLNKVTGEAEVLRPMIEACLDNDPVKRPSIAELSECIKPLKELLPMGKALQSGCYKLAWEKCANLPFPLYGASVALLDNKVYVMAVGAPDKETSNEVFKYDIHFDQWDKLPPSGHRRGILQIIDAELTIIGGLDTHSATRKISSKVTTFRDKGWTKVFPDMQKPRIRPGVMIHLNYVIVAGGALDESDFSDEIEILDWTKPNSDWVTSRMKLPEPMWFPSLTISGNLLYIVGYDRRNGRTTAAYQVSVDAITSSGDQPLMNSHLIHWHKVPKASHAGTTIIPNSCPPVIIGGYNHQGLTSDISILDGNAWKRIASLTTPKKYAAVVPISHDCILIIGGCTGGKGKKGAITNSTNTVEKGTMHKLLYSS